MQKPTPKNVKLVIGNKFYSSWSLRPWLVMTHFGMDFEEQVIFFKTGYKEKFQSANPSGTVPALVVDGLVIAESLAICEYLAEALPDQPLWPRDPVDRAKARALACEMHAGFSNLRTAMPMEIGSFYEGYGRYGSVRQDVRRIHALWQDCLEQDRSGPFLFGDFGIVDAMFAPVVSRFRTYDIHGGDLIEAYCEAVWSLPAMQEWVSDALEEQKQTGRIADF